MGSQQQIHLESQPAAESKPSATNHHPPKEKSNLPPPTSQSSPNPPAAQPVAATKLQKSHLQLFLMCISGSGFRVETQDVLPREKSCLELKTEELKFEFEISFKSNSSLLHQQNPKNSKNNNDPSAGSPTETLLRLLLPLDDGVQTSSRDDVQGGTKSHPNNPISIPGLHRSVQSVEATGGVYKGQGRNRRWLMTNAY